MPYSRTHETEADLLGLDIMAKAGYDPREAPKLWQAMKADKKESIPEWLSTHPSDDSRIAALQDRESEALSYMEAAHAAGKKPHCVMPK
jgi:predicted Zn-dependent protease